MFYLGQTTFSFTLMKPSLGISHFNGLANPKRIEPRASPWEART